MALRAILDAAVSIAQGTGVIAKVFRHKVYSSTDADLIALFTDPAGVKGIDACMITRENTPSTDKGPARNYDEHLLVLSWYRSMNRAADDSTNSEDAFQDDVETVRMAFKANRKLTVNGVNNSHWCGPMTARMVVYVMFQNVLCHYAELVVTAGDGPQATSSV